MVCDLAGALGKVCMFARFNNVEEGEGKESGKRPITAARSGQMWASLRYLPVDGKGEVQRATWVR